MFIGIHGVTPFDPFSVKLEDFTEQEGAGSFYFTGFPFQRGYGVAYDFQRGRGIGTFVRTLLRLLLPAAKSAGKAVGKEALVTGARIMDNIAQGHELKDTIVSEGKEGAKRLLKRMSNQSGSGARKPKRRKPAPKKKLPKTKEIKRITARDILGKRVINPLVLENPRTKLAAW